LLVDRIANQNKALSIDEPLPAEGKSFLRLDNPNVLLTTWKPAESGEGTIVRFEEIAGKEEHVALQLSGVTVRSARLCDAMEDDLTNLSIKEQSIQLAVKPHEVVTVRLVE
jgi:alpha-mannosidase